MLNKHLDISVEFGRVISKYMVLEGNEIKEEEIYLECLLCCKTEDTAVTSLKSSSEHLGLRKRDKKQIKIVSSGIRIACL